MSLTLKPSKCAFALEEIKFLGHIVSANGIEMDPEKVEAIARAPVPTSTDEVRRFIGHASYYRNFVKNFANIAAPLTKLTKKGEPFRWGEEQEKAYKILRERLVTRPIMTHFDAKVPVELRTDACGYGLGAVLLHVYPNGTKKVISYASRLMNKAELNYGITEKECLVIVWAVDKFRIYLQGIKFRVVTDHIALTWLKSKKDLTARLMRWQNLLQPYHFEVIYKSGKLHHDADHLSRLAEPGVRVVPKVRRMR